jgi:hypothetical protein
MNLATQQHAARQRSLDAIKEEIDWLTVQIDRMPEGFQHGETKGVQRASAD